MHTYIHTYIHTCIRTSCTYIHPHTNTYIHTLSHTCVCVCVMCVCVFFCFWIVIYDNTNSYHSRSWFGIWRILTGGPINFRAKGLEHTLGCVLKIEFSGVEHTTPPLSSTEKMGLTKLVVERQSLVVEFVSFPVVPCRAHFPHTRLCCFWK